MNKKLVVKQNSSKDCGPSCLLSIMKYYGFEASHEEITYILKTNNNGTNAYNIINGARNYGFDGFGIHYSYEEIVNNKISFPIICHVLKNNMYHFIVVYSANKKYLEVMDPSSNINKISKEEFKKIYLNTSIVIFPIKKFENIENHKSLYLYIFDYLNLEKNISIKLILLSIIITILGLVNNFYSLIVFDNILINFNYILLGILTIIFMINYVLRNFLSYIRNKYLINVENSLYKKLNIDIIRKFFHLPYQYIKNKSTGEIISRFNDSKLFKDLFSKIIVGISMDFIILFLSMIFLLIINYKIFLINLIQIILYLFVVLIYRRIYLYKTENLLIYEGIYNKILSENINSYEINKNLNLINERNKYLEIKFSNYIDKTKSFENTLNSQIFIKNLITDLCNLFIFFISIIFVYKKYISVGQMLLFNSLVYYFNEPIKNIFDLSININYIKNIYFRIIDLLSIKSEEEKSSLNELKGNIEIHNLSYSYDNIHYLFNDINFNVNYGSKYLIYGESGNGKSTIIKILLKYIHDYKGEIFINNINLKDINSKDILNNFTYVSQNSYLNNDTLKNNIVYDRNISDIEYEQIINICNLNNLRNSKPLRNNFVIEDNGFNISGGERQKIILARSLLKNCNYLILDEALSEINYKEEVEILNKIFKKYQNKTIIYISHKKEIIELFKNKYKLERSDGYN